MPGYTKKWFCSIIRGLFIFSGLFLFIFLSSCKKTDIVPSYIHIDHISVNTVYEVDGSNSSKITDAWVYVDDNLIGIYELPATFPVLATGTHNISVKAGIKIDGIAKSRAYYSFYQNYSVNLNLVAEKVDTIAPVVTYYPNKIHWREDFEEAGIRIVKYTGSDTSFMGTTNAADAFEGSYSGIAYLDAVRPYLLCVTDSTLDIPINGSPVFLEMNYKTDVYMSVGLLALTSTGSYERIDAMVLNPNTAWNKIYINLTPGVNTDANAYGFKVFFEANKPDSISDAKIFIDNLKLLYNN
jgi:hypothetical protein